jgi:tetratricopeptide (TPR) repeat protein
MHAARLLAFLLVLVPALGAAAAGPPLPDKLALLDLLRRGEFQMLEAALVGYQQRFEADHATYGPVVYDAFESFANSDAGLAPRLDEWVRAAPGSWVAPAARGHHHNRIGWISRGGQAADKASRDRMAAMGAAFERSEADLKKALVLNPRLITAWRHLADMAMARGDRAGFQRAIAAGLDVDPASPQLHALVLLALEPKWGGSYETIVRYLDVLRQHFPEERALKPLLGYVDEVKADALYYQGHYAEAVVFADRALGYGDDAGYLRRRIEAAFMSEREDEAEAMLPRALALAPQWAELCFLAARIASNAKRPGEPLDHAGMALALDGLNPRYLHGRALIYLAAGRFQDAAQDLDNAVIYGGDDPSIQVDRSSVLMRFKSRQGDAVAAARQATTLAPHDSLAWLQLSEALFLSQDCEAPRALDRYLALCGADGMCAREKERVAPSLIPRMSCPSATRCPVRRQHSSNSRRLRPPRALRRTSERLSRERGLDRPRAPVAYSPQRGGKRGCSRSAAKPRWRSWRWRSGCCRRAGSAMSRMTWSSRAARAGASGTSAATSMSTTSSAPGPCWSGTPIPR